MREVNNNFSLPVAVDTPSSGLSSTTILEYIQTPRRITSLCRLQAQEELTTSEAGSEIYVLSGDCNDHRQQYSGGQYLRVPHAINISSNNGCHLFIKANQHRDGDTGNRVIDTLADHHWLPGPVEGVSICPLHVFDTESIMLLRWDTDCDVKPRLNPQGEEILVISGQLRYRNTQHTPYSWLRNPIEDWGKWHGTAGTLVYYKSGHFPTSAKDPQDS